MTTYGGRFRYTFNITLLIAGVFGVAAGGMNSFFARVLFSSFSILFY
jgi:hypothetical protein